MAPGAATRSSAPPTGTATCSPSPAPACAVERSTVRRARRLRRAVHPLRHRRRPRPRRHAAWACATSARRSPASATSSRPPAAPHVPDRGLLRQLLALQHLALRRRPVLLPNLSLGSRRPALRGPLRADAAAAGVAARSAASSTPSGRRATRPSRAMLADICRALPSDEAGGRTALHARNAEPFDVRTVNWFIPDIDSPFYGGINTALRIADHLARDARRREPVRRLGQPARPLRPLRARGGVPGPRRLADRVLRRHARRSLDAVPEADVGDRDPVGDGVRRGALRRTRSGSST